MSLTFSTALRTARAAAIETELGASPIMKFRTGAPPSNVGSASTGTVVATLPLPADPFTQAGATISKSGTWEDTSADNAGIIGHFELCQSDDTVVIRGTVTETGGGGDVTVDNNDVNAGQPVTVTSFSITDGNAGS